MYGVCACMLMARNLLSKGIHETERTKWLLYCWPFNFHCSTHNEYCLLCSMPVSCILSEYINMTCSHRQYIITVRHNSLFTNNSLFTTDSYLQSCQCLLLLHECNHSSLLDFFCWEMYDHRLQAIFPIHPGVMLYIHAMYRPKHLYELAVQTCGITWLQHYSYNCRWVPAKVSKIPFGM